MRIESQPRGVATQLFQRNAVIYSSRNNNHSNTRDYRARVTFTLLKFIYRGFNASSLHTIIESAEYVREIRNEALPLRAASRSRRPLSRFRLALENEGKRGRERLQFLDSAENQPAN